MLQKHLAFYQPFSTAFLMQAIENGDKHTNLVTALIFTYTKNNCQAKPKSHLTSSFSVHHKCSRNIYSIYGSSSIRVPVTSFLRLEETKCK